MPSAATKRSSGPFGKRSLCLRGVPSQGSGPSTQSNEEIASVIESGGLPAVEPDGEHVKRLSSVIESGGALPPSRVAGRAVRHSTGGDLIDSDER